MDVAATRQAQGVKGASARRGRGRGEQTKGATERKVERNESNCLLATNIILYYYLFIIFYALPRDDSGSNKISTL